MAAKNNLPGTAVKGGAADRQTHPRGPEDHFNVSEVVSDRAAAPSPFGDDQTFPLPVEQLHYIPSTPA